jgi:hypothetical protein
MIMEGENGKWNGKKGGKREIMMKEKVIARRGIKRREEGYKNGNCTEWESKQ